VVYRRAVTNGWRLLAVAVGVVVVGALIGLYISDYLVGNTPSYTPPVQQSGAGKSVNLTIETVAAVGPQLASNHPDWVSYLVREGSDWKRTTVWHVPADATVHVTLYNFDGASGLRNPFFARPSGIVGPMKVDGRPIDALNPNDASHTFAVPALGIVIPIAPVGDNAKNQCGYAPCSLSMAHRTITFTFKTGASGHYRWQCFVPCAAGYVFGNGGPMQTIGYMSGFLNVG
jgi:hypothetical protein